MFGERQAMVRARQRQDAQALEVSGGLLLLRLGSSGLSLDLRAPGEPAVLYSALLEEVPDLHSLFFDSLRHLQRAFVEHASTLAFLNGSLLFRLPVLQQVVTVDIPLTARLLSAEEEERFGLARLQLEVSALVTRHRRELMRVDEETRQAALSVEQEKARVCEAARLQVEARKAAEARMLEIQKLREFLTKSDSHLQQLTRRLAPSLQLD